MCPDCSDPAPGLSSCIRPPPSPRPNCSSASRTQPRPRPWNKKVCLFVQFKMCILLFRIQQLLESGDTCLVEDWRIFHSAWASGWHNWSGYFIINLLTHFKSSLPVLQLLLDMCRLFFLPWFPNKDQECPPPRNPDTPQDCTGCPKKNARWCSKAPRGP